MSKAYEDDLEYYEYPDGEVAPHTPIVKSTELLFHKHFTDAGWDLESVEDVVVEAKEFAPMIHTGAHLEIPEGYFGLIKERSGMAGKGIFAIGGVIDAGYRGEIMINLVNIGGYDYVINSGDRIAQIIFIPCASTVRLDEGLSVSERGEDGFGSTGR